MEFGGGVAALANAIAEACALQPSYVIEPEVVVPVAEDPKPAPLEHRYHCSASATSIEPEV